MGKILRWLQGRVKHWTKPATSVLIIGAHSDLTRSHTDLVVENALLRQQLIILKRQVKRPQLTNADRIHLVLLAHFTKFWKQALLLFSLTPSCVGIRICFACIGSGSRKADQRLNQKRSF
jgi:hypothetical protein